MLFLLESRIPQHQPQSIEAIVILERIPLARYERSDDFGAGASLPSGPDLMLRKTQGGRHLSLSPLHLLSETVFSLNTS